MARQSSWQHDQGRSKMMSTSQGRASAWHQSGLQCSPLLISRRTAVVVKIRRRTFSVCRQVPVVPQCTASFPSNPDFNILAYDASIRRSSLDNLKSCFQMPIREAAASDRGSKRFLFKVRGDYVVAISRQMSACGIEWVYLSSSTVKSE